MFDFDSRYSENWSRIAQIAVKTVNNHCCLCLQRHHYLEVHHAVYCDKISPKIAGKELVGVHIFPLCKPCHHIAHKPENWKKDRQNPVTGNRNTIDFYLRLIDGFNGLIEQKRQRFKV